MARDCTGFTSAPLISHTCSLITSSARTRSATSLPARWRNVTHGEEHKEPLVVLSHAVVDPRTVVIHLPDASLTDTVEEEKQDTVDKEHIKKRNGGHRILQRKATLSLNLSGQERQ